MTDTILKIKKKHLEKSLFNGHNLLGKNLWSDAFKDAITKENLLKYFVKNETNALYIQGIKELQNKGFQIAAIVCDGRKGLLQSFGAIPVQMCQFHQSEIIRRYLTKNQS
ncbi:hypothetical protein CCAN2_2030079 [Capnocytophaga canimorsus]|nr:transposase [Capnocytophaga canimorsus]CEN50289.1 hypothetical protein CCAN2_2030079 [Capnocytophaga canimorsus]